MTISLSRCWGTLCALLVASVITSSGANQNEAAAPQCGDATCEGGADTTSLMQGVPRVELAELALNAQHSTKSHDLHPAKEEELEDSSFFQGPAKVKASNSVPAPATSHASSEASAPQLKSSSASLLGTWSPSATSGISLLVSSTRSAAPVLFFMLMLLVCTFIACMVISPQVPAKGQTEDPYAKEGLQRPVLGSMQRPPARGSPQASRLPWESAASAGVMPQYSPSQGRPSTSAFSDLVLGMAPGTSGFTAQLSPQPAAQMPAPIERPPLAPLSKQAPPPLCPTLVMPVCEARFGVQMNQLAALVSVGELDIVGLSGNPLLRAGIRLDRNGDRTLEICMPERNSAPRATLAPSSPGVYEIRGMKGVFYGFLQVQSSGSCYVIKDGQTVLLLDGDTENLQLGVKSGAGAPLASIRCSAEPFGGVDHVEIRVEAGVDTVLVLAVVLGVLLLCDR